jgi:hypothetical protein
VCDRICNNPKNSASDVATDTTAISNILHTLATKPRNGDHSGRTADGHEAAAAAPAPLTDANAAGPFCAVQQSNESFRQMPKMQQMAYFVMQNTDVAKAFFTLQMAHNFTVCVFCCVEFHETHENSPTETQ